MAVALKAESASCWIPVVASNVTPIDTETCPCDPCGCPYTDLWMCYNDQNQQVNEAGETCWDITDCCDLPACPKPALLEMCLTVVSKTINPTNVTWVIDVVYKCDSNQVCEGEQITVVMPCTESCVEHVIADDCCSSTVQFGNTSSVCTCGPCNCEPCETPVTLQVDGCWGTILIQWPQDDTFTVGLDPGCCQVASLPDCSPGNDNRSLVGSITCANVNGQSQFTVTLDVQCYDNGAAETLADNDADLCVITLDLCNNPGACDTCTSEIDDNGLPTPTVVCTATIKICGA